MFDFNIQLFQILGEFYKRTGNFYGGYGFIVTRDTIFFSSSTSRANYYVLYIEDNQGTPQEYVLNSVTINNSNVSYYSTLSESG